MLLISGLTPWQAAQDEKDKLIAGAANSEICRNWNEGLWGDNGQYLLLGLVL